jgi:DNA invertase Pin-like site-specific DNA recombinase
LTYGLDARKARESDERQALSIDSRIKEMLKLAQRDKIDVVDVRRESHSAKDSAAGPVFNQLIADILNGKFNSILTWAPDRISRNACDLGSLGDLMDQKLLWPRPFPHRIAPKLKPAVAVTSPHSRL